MPRKFAAGHAGGTLAAAAHSTKSGLRLMSTTKTFWGDSNFAISLGEDAERCDHDAAFPLCALGHVSDCHSLCSVICFSRTAHHQEPGVRSEHCRVSPGRDLPNWHFCYKHHEPQEFLLEITPQRLEMFTHLVDGNEELVGVLPGWKRSPGGPRRTRVCWFVAHSGLNRASTAIRRAQSLDYGEITLASTSATLFSFAPPTPDAAA